MFSSLYRSPGAKLKLLAKILLICGIVVSLVFAVLLSTDRYDVYDLWSFLDVILFAVLNFWKFIGILVGGLVVSYLFTLLIYAFGDQVENVNILSNKNTVPPSV